MSVSMMVRSLLMMCRRNAVFESGHQGLRRLRRCFRSVGPIGPRLAGS